jgi:hypothetical protein
MQEITLADMPIIRLSSSTTGTALMPCSTSTLATAGTVAPWSTEITSLVMMSTARIASPQAVLSNQQNPAWALPALTQIKQGEHYLLRHAERRELYLSGLRSAVRRGGRMGRPDG